MCRVASNERSKNKLTKKIFITCISSISLIILIKLNFNKTVNMNLIEIIINMFNSLRYTVLVLTIIYLLLTLFVTVVVSKIKFGPIRAKKN